MSQDDLQLCRPTNGSDLSDFWSTSDFVYMCLRDQRRTLAFRAALRASVNPGDRVIDVGSGSGILALFAAEAGAAEVLALERDPELARRLRRTVAANGLDGRIQVVEGDIFTTGLPRADVLVAELIETGLIDERQVPVHNHLVSAGVIDEATTVVPGRYETSGCLVRTVGDFYGFQVDTVRHDWPFYADDPAEHWLPVRAEVSSETFAVWSSDFGAALVDPDVRFTASIPVHGPDHRVDAVRLSGLVGLTAGLDLGPCPAMNGDKVLPLPAPVEAEMVDVAIAYRMGEGIGGLELDVRPG